MSHQPTNTELYNVIQQLCSKIENLEKKIDKLNENRETNIDKVRRKLGLDIPDVFDDWISLIKVEKKHYDTMFTVNGGIVATFKDVVLEYMNLSDFIPLYKYNRSVYVYQLIDDEAEWCLFDNDHLIKMVKCVWQKLLAIQLDTNYDDNEDDEIKDQKRRVVIQMRQKLCDTKSNRDAIMKLVKGIL